MKWLLIRDIKDELIYGIRGTSSKSPVKNFEGTTQFDPEDTSDNVPLSKVKTGA